jgi:hypothetical protein
MLEPENKHIKKKDIKVRVSLGKKVLDTLTLLEPQREVIVPLSNKLSEDKVIIVCQTTTPLVDGAYQLGSVSIPQTIIYNGGVGTYMQWITLFEHEDDDEYDGEMGIDDDEDPRVRVRFITEEQRPKQQYQDPPTKPKQAFNESRGSADSKKTTSENSGVISGRASPVLKSVQANMEVSRNAASRMTTGNSGTKSKSELPTQAARAMTTFASAKDSEFNVNQRTKSP